MKHSFSAALALLCLANSGWAQSYVINTLAGSDRLRDGSPALSVPLRNPNAVVADNAGNLYINDFSDFRIRKVNAAGIISTYVGIGFEGYIGDGGSATQAAVDTVAGMALDSSGNLYIADYFNSRIRKVDLSGKITTVAGNGNFFFTGDGGLATANGVSPVAVAVDGSGNLYIADYDNCRIRKVTASTGVISTIAGDGNCNYSGDGGLAISAEVSDPTGIAVDAAGNVYFTDYANNRVRKIAIDGTITTIAGNGASTFAGDGGPATVAALDPLNVAVDAAGNVFVADWGNDRIRKITASTGVISTVAGDGTGGFAGDGAAATAAEISEPVFVAVDSAGDLYIADDGNGRVRKVTTAGNISTVAGAPIGDGGPANTAFLNFPFGITVDSHQNLYIADANDNRIRVVASSGTISTVAGSGVRGFGDGAGKAIDAQLSAPQGVAVDGSRNLYIADTGNYRIRKVTPSGAISTIAGDGRSRFTGDGGPATSAEIGLATGIAADAAGNVYFADNSFSRVRKISATGTISTVAGNGNSSFAGDGGMATAAQLDPVDVAVDPAGNLYVADRSNNRIRKIDTAGIITTVAGSSDTGYAGDGGPATSASLSDPSGVAVDADGNVYIADYDNYVVRRVSAKTGIISTIAGSAKDYVYAGDGGPALAAQLDGFRVAVSGTTLYVTDALNDRVRSLTLQTPTAASASAGDAQTGVTGTQLPTPLSVTVLDANGIPVAGVTVQFVVTAGTATLTPGSAVTGLDGVASTQVLFGASPGAVTITATPTNLPPVTFNLTATAAAPPATISSGGVVGAGLSIPQVQAVSPNSIMSVFGLNFAPSGTFKQVGQGDLVNGQVPTNVAGVCVLVNSNPAPIFLVTPTQVNFQVPQLPASGAVNVQVATNCGTGTQASSNSQSVTVQAAAPEFFYFVQNQNGKNPIAAVNAVTGKYIGAPGLIPGATFVPAKPGDILTLYVTGLGATNPPYLPGQLPDKAANVVGTVTIKIGAVALSSSDVLYAGVTGGNAGLYQINLKVPASVPAGDQAVVVTVGGVSSPSGGFITVKH